MGQLRANWRHARGGGVSNELITWRQRCRADGAVPDARWCFVWAGWRVYVEDHRIPKLIVMRGTGAMGERLDTPTGSSKGLSEDQFSFHLEEFKSLREEVARMDNAKRQIELFTLTAAAVIVSWLFTNADRVGIVRILWWSPFIIAVRL
jgi:hypothetical protein